MINFWSYIFTVNMFSKPFEIGFKDLWRIKGVGGRGASRLKIWAVFKLTAYTKSGKYI